MKRAVVIGMSATVVFAAVLLAAPAWGQEPRGYQVTAPGAAQETSQRSSAGSGYDPSENVKALNAAEAKRQDDLRKDEAKFQNAMREAETRRVDQLAAQKQLFDLELARVLKGNVDSSALLLSTQLKEVKTDLSDRTSHLEQFRWETGGRTTGVSDFSGWIAAGIMMIISLGSLAVNLFLAFKPHRDNGNGNGNGKTA